MSWDQDPIVPAWHGDPLDVPAPPASFAPPTLRQRVQASAPGQVLQGARDPIDGGAQLLPRALSFITSAGGALPNRVSDWLDSEAARVDSMNAGNEREYQDARRATATPAAGPASTAAADPGFDAWRFAGNLVSPANAAVAARLPVAASTGMRVLQGATAGATGAALAPVQDTQNFAGEKFGQVALGAATGGVLAPLTGKLGDAFQRWRAGRQAPVVNIGQADEMARAIAADAGAKFESLSPNAQQQLRDQVVASLESRSVDPKALARKQDFDAEGMSPTLGQITRDGRQYATERNLRQLPGTGDPLLQRFEQQGRQLQQKVGGWAEGASDRYAAGRELMDAAASVREGRSAEVRDAYRQARAAAGKDAEVPMQGLAQDVAEIFDRYRTAVPSGIRGQFAKYGLDPSEVVNQRRVFTVEEADKLLKEINRQGGREPATQSALSDLRAAVKRAVMQDAGVDDVFAPARRKAADLFQLEDQAPAIKAAAEGSVPAEDFVRRYVTGGKADQVSLLAKLLKGDAPQAYQQARTQIGRELMEAAYGMNATGDKAFSPERYLRKVNQMRTNIGAFFEPDELQQIERVGRIGAYVNQPPNASPVNTSGNWGAITNLATRIPGVPILVGAAGAAKQAVGNQMAVRRSLAAKVPQIPAQPTPEQLRALGLLLSGGASASGLASAQMLEQ